MKDNLDDLDLKILTELLQDARRPYTDIAKKLFVSSGTIHVRMNKMEEMGIVDGSSIAINLEKLKLDVVAFLGIFLSKSSLYDEVSHRLSLIPEIVEAHYTTGNYSIFARIVCRDTNHLREVLHDKIQEIEGIQRTETFISLEESFRRPISLVEEENTF